MMRSPRDDRTGSFLEVMDRLSMLFDDLDAWSKRNSGKNLDHPDKTFDEKSDNF